MSEADISEASRRYRAGEALAAIGKSGGVHPTTVRRELLRAGVKLRRRQGS
jgi:hypothetical protein